MNMQADFTEYLGRMLGRSVRIDEPLTLTSVQQARAAGWLAERGFAPPQLRALLGGRFIPARLVSGATAPVVDDCGFRRQSRAEGEKPALQRIGIDIQRVEDVVPPDALADLKSSAEVTAVFTLREISYAQSRPSPGETLCGLFCAKEALRKCDAALLALPLREVEVLPDERGQPRFQGFSLSISHSGGFAVAVAVNEAPGPPPAPSVSVAAVPQTTAALPSAVAASELNSSSHTDLRLQPQPRPGYGSYDALRRAVHARAAALFENLLRRLDPHLARWRR